MSVIPGIDGLPFVNIDDTNKINSDENFKSFDKVMAYKKRLQAFQNGVCYVYCYQYGDASPAKQKAIKESYAEVQKMVDAKLKQIDDISRSQPQKPIDSGVLFIELEHVLSDFAKKSGLSKEDIALGEAFWAWQVYKHPNPHITPDYEEGGYRIRQSDTYLKSALTFSQKEELRKIHKKPAPEWFKRLPEWSKTSLRAIVPTETPGNWVHYEESTIPTTLRHIPGQSNATQHGFQIFEPGTHEPIIETISYKQAVPTSYQMPKAYHASSANQNMQQLLTDIGLPDIGNAKRTAAFKKFWGIAENDAAELPEPPVLFLGLLSTTKQGNWLQKIIDFRIPFLLPLGIMGKENSSVYAEDKARVVRNLQANKEHVFQFNVPINANRNKVPEEVDTTFLTYVDGFANSMQGHPKKAWLDSALAALKAHNDAKELPGRNKNIYLAALYEVNLRLMGGLVIRNCKSSKDRCAFVTILAEAMLIYYVKNKTFPSCDAAEGSPERNDFVQIIYNIYRSGHHSDEAGYNSPGSGGIKDEKMLDMDIVRALDDQAIKYYILSKEIANFNKPKTNFDKFKKPCKVGFAALALIGIGLTVALLATGVLAPAAFITGVLATQLASGMAIGSSFVLPTASAMIFANIAAVLYPIATAIVMYCGLAYGMNSAKRNKTFEAKGLINASKGALPLAPPTQQGSLRGSQLDNVPKASSYKEPLLSHPELVAGAKFK